MSAKFPRGGSKPILSHPSIVCDVQLPFVTFSCGILGQVWYLIASIHDLCHLSYYDPMRGSRGGGGQEVWIPLKNHKNIVLHSNIGPDPLTNQKATKPAFHDGPLIFGIWILPPIINLKKALSKLDPLWQNSLDPRIDPDL